MSMHETSAEAAMDAPIPACSAPDMRAITTLSIGDDGEPLVMASLAPERVLARPRYFVEGLPGALPECFVRAGLWERLHTCAAGGSTTTELD